MPAHDTDDAMRAFVAEFGLEGMTQVVDDDGELWARFGVGVQPAWSFVRDGRAVDTVYGALSSDGLAERIGTNFERRSVTVRVVLFDLMDTVLTDPYRDALAAATTVPLAECSARRDPDLWPAFERGELDEDAYWAGWAACGIVAARDAFHAARRAGTGFVDGMADLLDELEGAVSGSRRRTTPSGSTRSRPTTSPAGSSACSPRTTSASANPTPRSSPAARRGRGRRRGGGVRR